jgi:hypothetical protein
MWQMDLNKSVIAVRQALYGSPIKRRAQHNTEKWQWLADKIAAQLRSKG